VGEVRARTRIVSEPGRVARHLAAEVEALPASRVVVVADRGFADAGLLEPVIGSLPLAALVDVDPGLDAAAAVGDACLALGADGVVIVGGGSALCAGKAAAIRLTNSRPLVEYMGRDRLDALPAPCIAVPTTAGSGSEVSTVVVLHDRAHTGHVVIRGTGYEPDVALLDGTLLVTLPDRPLVEAALDALSHALEALWARRATAFTDALALSAASSIRAALPLALSSRPVDALQALFDASAMANLACGNAEMGLVHALSAAPSVHLPHGYQNGVLLPWVAAYNRPAVREAVVAEIDALPALYEAIGFSPRFTEVDAAGADAMVAAAMESPFRANNVRAAHEAELRELLRAAGAGE
jgi:alcohol dehydrogenase class IV